LSKALRRFIGTDTADEEARGMSITCQARGGRRPERGQLQNRMGAGEPEDEMRESPRKRIGLLVTAAWACSGDILHGSTQRVAASHAISVLTIRTGWKNEVKLNNLTYPLSR